MPWRPVFGQPAFIARALLLRNNGRREPSKDAAEPRKNRVCFFVSLFYGLIVRVTVQVPVTTAVAGPRKKLSRGQDVYVTTIQGSESAFRADNGQKS